MLALERRNRILEKLQTEKSVVVSDLSHLFSVSEETIRRDLDKLEREGHAVKSYGGAVVNEEPGIDLPFNIRKNHNVEGKQKLAEMIGPLLHEGERLFLDSSSTAVFIAKALKNRFEKLTIITNSIENLLELSDMPGWKVISTGGEMDGGYLAFLGSRTEETIHSYYVDTAVISCKALDLNWGAMESQEGFSTVKRAMLSCARRRILAADSSKFDQTAFCRSVSMKEIDLVVTDREPSGSWMNLFRDYEIDCVFPQV